MKGNKHGFRRILAILLSVMLFVSNLALTAFADEGTATLTDREENAGEIINDSNPEYVLPGTDTYMITASVLTYARSCVIKKKGTEEEKNLGKALYLYNAAAVAAFGQ